jgi:hypothetical protein
VRTTRLNVVTPCWGKTTGSALSLAPALGAPFGSSDIDDVAPSRTIAADAIPTTVEARQTLIVKTSFVSYRIYNAWL